MGRAQEFSVVRALNSAVPLVRPQGLYSELRHLAALLAEGRATAARGAVCGRLREPWDVPGARCAGLPGIALRDARRRL
jgi:hypothetical protein